jgi:hypothetical protein
MVRYGSVEYHNTKGGINMYVKDIYEYAKDYNADYMDKHGNIFKVQEYNHAVRSGLPTEGIKVYDSLGNYLGIAQRKDS